MEDSSIPTLLPAIMASPVSLDQDHAWPSIRFCLIDQVHMHFISRTMKKDDCGQV